MEYDVEQYFYLKSREYHPIDKKKGIKIEQICRKRLGCIAIGVNVNEIDESWVVTFTGSACSKLDNFNVKAGRSIALNRLRSDNEKTRKYTILDEYVDKVDLLWKVLNELHLDFALDAQYVDMEFCNKRFNNIIDFIKKKVKEIQNKEVVNG